MSEEKSGGGISLATKSRWKTPENFFPVVIDNFFDDPEALANYGKSLPKVPEPEGRWPGVRSKNLWEIDNILFQAIMMKILSCYYDLGYIEIGWKKCNMSFQEIPRFSENKNDIKNRGWIHQDGGEWQLAGLIYLTPNIDPDSGTSLYNLKSAQYGKVPAALSKRALFKDGLFDKEEYTKNLIKHEENFSEKIRFQNIFNRLILYDTCEWHRANSYYNGDGKDARLTLAFFVGGINEDVPVHEQRSISPLKRTKNSEFESVIKLQIAK